MCPSGVTYPSADSCFSELALYKNPTKHVGLVQSGLHHHLTSHCKLICSCHDIAEQIAELALNNNHSLTPLQNIDTLNTPIHNRSLSWLGTEQISVQ
jgi:hypothetical protein